MEHPVAAAERAKAAAGKLGATRAAAITLVMNDSRVSYPVGFAIQLAYAVANGGNLDIRQRQPGARGAAGVAGRVGSFLVESHIPSVDDAFQNIGKNQPNLVRGNFAAFDDLLAWGARATVPDLQAALDLAAVQLAAKSRPILPMPILRQSELSFAAVMALFDALLATPSEGAHEQLMVAAVLHALLQQAGLSGLRVETKRITAADDSSKAAGDVQILTGNRVIDAFEVTAAQWSSKLGGAAQKAKTHDLARIHVLAPVPKSDRPSLIAALAKLPSDVSVLDLREFVATVVAALDKPHRAEALKRFHELLARFQPKADRVNGYVELLGDRRLVQ